MPTICAEIERLLSLYGDNSSFRRYGTQLLDFAASTQVAEKTYLARAPAITRTGYELPLRIRIALGQLAVDRKPVPADWAVAWALSDPNVVRRTPVTRCAELFAELFKQKYAEGYGEGLATGKSAIATATAHYLCGPALARSGC